MRRLVMILAAGVVPVSVLVPASSAAPAAPTATACTPVPVQAPAGARVESVVAVARPGGTVTFPSNPPFPPTPPVDGVPAYCEVTVTLTHGSDHVKVMTLLPEQGWNQRFQALGGSAYAAGDVIGDASVKAVKAGYAAATTDAGVGPSPIDPAWALTAQGKVDQTLLKNFAHRSPHELAVVGKAVTKAYYGRAANYAYWNGCSTGGRQGYSEAQRYPGDFDGILAASAAINWDRWAPSAVWPAVVVNQEKHAPTSCELEAFNAAAIKACDTKDGVRDGVIAEPSNCTWAPESLIGQQVECYGEQVTITAADARIVRRIWEGPKGLWYGLTRGTTFAGLLPTPPDQPAAPLGAPFVVGDAWVKYFLKQNPGFDTKTVWYADFVKLFLQSELRYNAVIGTDDPDLSAYQKSGGKLLAWHGLDDQLITAQGSVDYRKRVERTVGGNVDSFYRLFLAPGAVHCGPGAGPAPADPLASLVQWVEHGKAPNTLPAATADGSTVRNLCAYPKLPRYAGGDPKVATSYRCA
ncbi:tannase/feruloyl esterase family alpha/beta hydrolase [Kribbella sp. NPDC051770]|uniref:tannase/feruloyl esterase family alpha/beta hydrolase n=1 Tax=Kribbella sp. NPDC051770 TaxID=3155413 RepID=UPI00341A3732